MSGTLVGQVRELAKEGFLRDALRELNQLLSANLLSPLADTQQFRELRNDITVSMGRLTRAERQRRLGSEDSIVGERVFAQIASAILQFADEVESLMARGGAYLPASGPVSAPSLTIARSEFRPEQIWGRGNLQNLVWLHKGLDCARSVARLVTPGGIGTGFLMGNNLIMTNNHVLRSSADASASVVEFNYEEDEFGQLQEISRYKIDPSKTFVTDEHLDCTIVAIKDGGAMPLSSWGHLNISFQSLPELGAPVSIIQHPFGGVKKICLTGNEVVNIYEPYLQYSTDTEAGSSGSPVFDENWNVVALHHAGGKLKKNAEGEHIYANQGVLIKSIYSSLQLSSLIS